MLNMIIRTFLFAFFLQLVRSPVIMMIIGIGIGMYFEHSKPGTTAVALHWASGQVGEAIDVLNPFAGLLGETVASPPAPRWDNGGYALR
ncbi:hypothetical protein [Azospirillum canadense]|uniref:hypothetical protein n=1 Tax=Azospirillum canadense TaxID=403962 RepID=UPI002226E28B|nr:hypothetical protein [Azospirillum canadense]MCW2239265.1 putative membrane protein [Azospirillum canadense]